MALTRNLVISQGLCVVNTLLLVLHIQEVWNFELWEQERAAKRVPAQDWGVEEEQDCFRMSVTVRVLFAQITYSSPKQ